MTTGDHVPSDSVIPSPRGLILAPFRALRYADTADNHPATLLCPPYDVIDAEQQAALERADPRNAVRLILPRDDQSGPGSRYRRAAHTLAAWRATGILQRDRQPALYVYEMATTGGRNPSTTRGLLGALGLADPAAGIVLPHENTMPGPVADRLALTQATEANLEPIYLVYNGTPTVGQVVAGVDDTEPLTDASTDDGIRHRLWAVTDRDALRTVAAELLSQAALIADGHHRYATYLAEQHDRHRHGAGPGPWDSGLAYLVDARRFGPRVEAIHRVLPAYSMSTALGAAAGEFAIQEIAGPAGAALSTLASAGQDATAFVLTDGADWRLLRRPRVPADTANALGQLDVTVAHHLLIEQLWGLDQDVVEYEHDADRAIARAGKADGLALLLNPTGVQQVADVAAAGQRMPRKSTLFTPKPATGLVFRPYDDA